MSGSETQVNENINAISKEIMDGLVITFLNKNYTTEPALIVNNQTYVGDVCIFPFL